MAMARAEKRADGPRRPSTLAVPASRPRPSGGLTPRVRQVGPGAGRGRPHGPGAPLAAAQEPERRSTPRPRDRGPSADGAPTRSRPPGEPPRPPGPGPRPCSSREAVGSPAPRQDPVRPVGRANAVVRVRRSATARAHGGAQTLNAWPGPWGVSTRARAVWPAGWCRQPRTAAAEKAHGSAAWPIVAPEVPSRVPADALAPGLSRPEATTSWSRGPRVLS